jgi:hypothetical protein
MFPVDGHNQAPHRRIGRNAAVAPDVPRTAAVLYFPENL